jgi:murein L,D-transpeptidase YcbB/YkuD
MKKIIISDDEKNNIRQMHESFKNGSRIIKEDETDVVLTKQVQCFLRKKGYKISDNGDYGNDTKQAVKQFQTSKKITPDGDFGSKTLDSLTSDEKIDFESCGDTIDKIQSLFMRGVKLIDKWRGVK